MLKPLVRLLRLLDSERTDSQQAPDLGQMNGDESRQCVGHLLGKLLLPSAIPSCPRLVSAVKLTMHSVPVRRENEPCCPSGLVAEKLGKVHKAVQMEKICLFFPPVESLKFGPVVYAKQCTSLGMLSIVLHWKNLESRPPFCSTWPRWH